MTPQELEALREGTRIKFSLAPTVEPTAEYLNIDYGYDYGCDFGTVVRSGAICQIEWDKADEDCAFFISVSSIDTRSESWTRFIQDISLVEK